MDQNNRQYRLKKQYVGKTFGDSIDDKMQNAIRDVRNLLDFKGTTETRGSFEGDSMTIKGNSISVKIETEKKADEEVDVFVVVQSTSREEMEEAGRMIERCLRNHMKTFEK